MVDPPWEASNVSATRAWWLRLAGASVLVLAVVGALAGAPAASAATPKAIISLTFDDGFISDTTNVEPVLQEYGMNGTFYVISDRVGTSGYMSWDQIAALYAAGGDIGGHTVDHVNLAPLSEADVRQQVCGNREDLLSRGFPATSFAYPYGTAGTMTAEDEQVVEDCGYDSARSSLWYGADCTSGCTNPLPPPDPFMTTVIGWGENGLSALEAEVTEAESEGGWGQLVFHGVCDPTTDVTCDDTDGSTVTDPVVFDAFISWLNAQVADGAVAVETVAQVSGGAAKPLVEPPTFSEAPSGTSASTSATLAFSGEDDATYTCSIDGGPFAACSSPVMLTGVRNGGHSFEVEQTDTNGDVSTATSAAWTVAGPAQPPTFTSVPPAASNSSSAQVAFTGAAGAAFACSLDGGSYQSCSSPVMLAGLADGQHTVAVEETDSPGNTSSPATTSWDIDTDVPSAPTLSDVPPASTTSTSATIGFSGAAGASFACSVDGGAFAACTSPTTLNGLALGAHSLAVAQTNTFGTTSAAATASWTVAAVAPPPATSPVTLSVTPDPVTAPLVAPVPVTPSPVTPPVTTSVASLAAVRTLVDHNGDVLIALACRGGSHASCQGEIIIERLAGARKPQATIYAHATYTIAPGKRRNVVLHLSKGALKLLARSHTLRAALTLKGRNGDITHQRALTLEVSASKKASLGRSQ